MNAQFEVVRRGPWSVIVAVVSAAIIALPGREAEAQVIGGKQSAQLVPMPADRLQTNLLGNGGFEQWSLGVTPLGSVPPDLWYPMGSTTNLFGQSSIAYDRVNGIMSENAVAIWPATFNGFISQTLENGTEFRGKTVTFSVDLEPDIDCGNPTSEIQIYDGVTTSSTTQMVSGIVRLSVSHTVSSAASRVELRIYPRGLCVIADNAQAILGQVSNAPYVPEANAKPELPHFPLGAVIDWWRPNGSVEVPERFKICDGTPVNDPASPFNGLATPNLLNQFIRGVTSPNQIGISGGSPDVDLSHSHSMEHTHSGTTDASNQSFGIPNCSQACGSFPYSTHTHTFTTAASSSPATGSALGTVSVLPPYVGLLKLVRIK
jgi:hypothetical protein